MKIIYSGKGSEFTAQLQEKLESRLSKISKMIERDGEKEAHVMFSRERFLHNVEVTVHAWDHDLVCLGSDGDLHIALTEAVDKLEKQVVRLREKWRATHRHYDKEAAATANAEEPAPERAGAAAVNGRAKPKVFHVKESDGHKPMTLEEALVEMDDVKDYMVYRDANTERLSVLLRRPDGNFDLVES